MLGIYFSNFREGYTEVASMEGEKRVDEAPSKNIIVTDPYRSASGLPAMNTTSIKSILLSLIMVLPVCGEDSAEVENVARKYFKAFGDQDCNVLASLMHPKVMENMKPNILQSVPKTTQEIAQENKETVNEVIRMLKVDSPEAAWALQPNDLYKRMMTHMYTTQTMKIMKQSTNEILDVKVKGEGINFTVDLHAVSTLGDDRFEGVTHINLEKLDGKFYVVSMTKTRISPKVQ